MTTRKVIFTYGLIALYSISPLVSVLIASGIASATGSQLDEGGVHPCIIHGVDIGGALNTMFVCGWFFFLTIPTGALAMIIFTIIWLVLRNKAKRAASGV